MSTSYPSTGVSAEAAGYGGFVDALGGIATIVLAIIGLAGVRSLELLSIATIVFGAALLIQGGAMLTEFAAIEASPQADGGSAGGGLGALFGVGVAGIILGVLALLGVEPMMLNAVAVIAFGGALLISSTAVWQLLTSRSVATRFQTGSSMLRVVASEIATGSSSLQAMAGLAVIILGVLAVAGISSLALALIALIVAGCAIVLTGSTLSGTMMGFMRSSTAPTTASPSRLG
jgi:hypothetical protein